MATITNNQVQAGRAELCNYFKSPYQIINALNRFAATNDLTALNAELEADGQKECLSNEAFHAVATAVQEHHGVGRSMWGGRVANNKHYTAMLIGSILCAMQFACVACIYAISNNS